MFRLCGEADAHNDGLALFRAGFRLFRSRQRLERAAMFGYEPTVYMPKVCLLLLLLLLLSAHRSPSLRTDFLVLT